MPNTNAPYNTSLTGRFVQNMFDHHGSLWSSDCLCRLREGERALVLHGEIGHKDAVNLITQRSWFGLQVAVRDLLRGTLLPQRSDDAAAAAIVVVVSKIDLVAKIHSKVTVQTLQPVSSSETPHGRTSEVHSGYCLTR